MSQVNSTRNGCKDVFHAFLVENATYAGDLEIPRIAPEDSLPMELIRFSKAVSTKEGNPNAWVHFYEDDSLSNACGTIRASTCRFSNGSVVSSHQTSVCIAICRSLCSTGTSTAAGPLAIGFREMVFPSLSTFAMETTGHMRQAASEYQRTALLQLVLMDA